MLPSPPANGFDLGPIRIHFYALCVMAGIVFAWWLSNRRWRARGGHFEGMERIVIWAVPFGIVGARLYHIATHLEDYFGPGRDPFSALYIWEGGLGIMGGVALGAVGAWIAARREKVSLALVADVLAPGLVFAQAIGRLGNYFNQELFGGPTTLPWAVQIAPGYRPAGLEQFATFHPTFLYEMVWDIAVGLVLLWLDRRFAMGRGKLFFAYVALYLVGRQGTEILRTDPAELIFGIRNHQFIAACLLVSAIVVLVWLFRYRPGRDPDVGVLNPQSARPHEPARGRSPQSSPRIEEAEGGAMSQPSPTKDIDGPRSDTDESAACDP